MSVVSFVISCVAAVIAVGVVWYVCRQGRVVERVVADMKCCADVAAGVGRERCVEEVVGGERQRVRFALEFQKGQTYLLRNVGLDSAYGVRVETRGLVAQGRMSIDEFSTSDTQKYLLAGPWGGPDYITVTWHHSRDRSDARRSMKLNLGKSRKSC